MREADFFLHAKRYLSPDVHKEWTSAANRVIVDVRQFSNVTSLVSFISELPENPYRVVDLRFLGQSKVSTHSSASCPVAVLIVLHLSVIRLVPRSSSRRSAGAARPHSPVWCFPVRAST